MQPRKSIDEVFWTVVFGLWVLFPFKLLYVYVGLS